MSVVLLNTLLAYLPTTPNFSQLSRILHCRLNVLHFLFFELSYSLIIVHVHSLRGEKETDLKAHHDEAEL